VGYFPLLYGALIIRGSLRRPDALLTTLTLTLTLSLALLWS
jgi:hypothetical protein